VAHTDRLDACRSLLAERRRCDLVVDRRHRARSGPVTIATATGDRRPDGHTSRCGLLSRDWHHRYSAKLAFLHGYQHHHYRRLPDDKYDTAATSGSSGGTRSRRTRHADNCRPRSDTPLDEFDDLAAVLDHRCSSQHWRQGAAEAEGQDQEQEQAHRWSAASGTAAHCELPGTDSLPAPNASVHVLLLVLLVLLVVELIE